jgi:hypothetical protein
MRRFFFECIIFKINFIDKMGFADIAIKKQVSSKQPLINKGKSRLKMVYKTDNYPIILMVNQISSLVIVMIFNVKNLYFYF